MPKVDWTSDIKKVLRDNAKPKAEMTELRQKVKGVGAASNAAGRSMRGMGRKGMHGGAVAQVQPLAGIRSVVG